MTTSKLDRDLLLQTLRGYEEANRFIESEKRARLKNMTDEQARAVFDGLCHGYVEMSKEENARLADMRIEHHLRVRHAMALLAQKMGLYEPAL